MSVSERTLLLSKGTSVFETKKLSLLFAVVCIVDVFGVFPVVVLPKAIIDCGFYGILVVLSVCTVQIYTASLLGRCWIVAEELDPSIRRKNRYPYSALTEFTYGSTLANFVSFLLDVTVFGGGIPNLIVASQNLELLGLRLSNSSFDISYCYWIIITGFILCPILWLGSPKDMKCLCSMSVAIVALVFVLLLGCLFSLDNNEIQPINANFNPQRPLWEMILAAYGIISFQYDIHPSILTIQVDMKDQKKVTKALILGFGCSLGMFALITLGILLKVTEIQTTVLENLPATIPLHLAAFLVALQLCLSSAVSNSALYQHVEDCMSISRVFNHRRCILRTTLTLLAIIIAESVPRFDLVMSLIGGTLTAPLVFILPPMFYLKLLVKVKQERNKKEMNLRMFGEVRREYEEPTTGNLNTKEKAEIALCLFIITISIFCTIATTFVNVNSAIAYTQFTQPCIFNVSSALINL